MFCGSNHWLRKTAMRREREVDIDALSNRLGVPVVATNARNGDGIDELRAALIAFDGADQAGNAKRPWSLPEKIEAEIQTVSRAFEETGIVDKDAADGAALVWLTDYLTGAPTARVACEDFLAPLPSSVGEAVKAAAQRVLDAFEEPASVIIEARYAWISQQSQGLVRSLTKEKPRRTVTDRVDSVLTHRLWGLGVLSLVLAAVFYSIFALADPLMGLIETAQGTLAGWVTALIPEGTLQSLVVDGIINGVGSVLIFLPQICILFLFLSILEDSGYMARAAFMKPTEATRPDAAPRSENRDKKAEVTKAEPTGVTEKRVPASSNDGSAFDVLHEILDELRLIRRDRQYQDFSFAQLAGAIAQAFALFALAYGLYSVVNEQGETGLYSLLSAMVFQLMALTGFMMTRRR